MNEPWWKSSLAGIVTCASLLAFFWFVIYLLQRTGDEDLSWARSVYLLTGIEAISFASLGWLFGKEVHRREASIAESRAQTAEQQWTQAEREKAEAVKEAAAERSKGGTFAAAVHSVIIGAEPDTMELQPKGSGNRRTTSVARSSELNGLAELAMRLYPNSVASWGTVDGTSRPQDRKETPDQHTTESRDDGAGI